MHVEFFGRLLARAERMFKKRKPERIYFTFVSGGKQTDRTTELI